MNHESATQHSDGSTCIAGDLELRTHSQKEEGAAETTKDYYDFIWEQVRQLAPSAVLLRGPAHLDPVQTSGSGDLDILVEADFSRIRSFLRAEGFYRVYKPQTYIERFRLRVPNASEPYTIDLYKAERWGWGFRLADGRQAPADPYLAALVHAVADGKGTAYFEREHNGPPWQAGRHDAARFGRVGRVLWRIGNSGLLTLYLLLAGVIRPDPLMILQNLCRRAAYRILQLTRKMGLEVALVGVDGVGKTSLAEALLHLPAPVKVVYMGPHDYQTRVMRFVLKHNLPVLLRRLAFRYELLARRVYGWLFSRKGWIVVYPAERLEPQQRSTRGAILDGICGWRVDLTFWLTGARRRESPAENLRAIDQRLRHALDRYEIPFEKIDVSRNDANSVIERVSNRILAQHQERVSVDGFPEIFRAICY